LTGLLPALFLRPPFEDPFSFVAMFACFDFLEGDGVGEAKGLEDPDAPLSNFLLSEGEDGRSSMRDFFEDVEEDEEVEVLGSGLFLLLCSDCSEDIYQWVEASGPLPTRRDGEQIACELRRREKEKKRKVDPQEFAADWNLIF
jgi:hypothetical protein